MDEPFRPTPLEFEALVKFWAANRTEMLLHRLETGWAGRTDGLAIAEATERLAEIAAEIGEEEVGRIVAEVEDEHRRAVGDEVWRVLKQGTPEERAAMAEQWDRRKERQTASIEIHNVVGDAGSGHWLHTHGMDRLGLPELEIRGVPSFLVDAAAGLIRHVCGYMQEPSVVVKLGETMQVGPHSRLRLERAESLASAEDHYHVERWTLAQVPMTCSECGATACAGHS